MYGVHVEKARAGADLRSLVEESRAIRNLLQGLEPYGFK